MNSGRVIIVNVIIFMIASVCSALNISMKMKHPQTIFLTGATDGIGKHTCEKLASDGYNLLIHGRKSPSDSVVKSLVKDLQSRGAEEVAYLQADLSDLDQVEDLAKQAITQLQAWQSCDDPMLDVLINNAGVFDPDFRHSVQGYENTMAINVLAPFVLTRRLLPSLIRNAKDKNSDTRIITTSSISQSSTLPDIDMLFAKRGKTPSGHSSYSYSKLGDLLFTVKLAKLTSSYNIQCLTMDPGTVNTKMLLAGWGACGIPVKRANNTYKLATGEEYALGKVPSGSYHFGGSPSRDASGDSKLQVFWDKLVECTGVSYDL